MITGKKASITIQVDMAEDKERVQIITEGMDGENRDMDVSYFLISALIRVVRRINPSVGSEDIIRTVAMMCKAALEGSIDIPDIPTDMGIEA